MKEPDMNQIYYQSVLQKCIITAIKELEINIKLVLMNCRILLEKKWDELTLYDINLMRIVIQCMENTDCFSELVQVYIAMKDEYYRKQKVFPD
jgi:hypothetical protein